MNIIITGTSRGLGKYLSEYYLKKGNVVIGCSRSEINIDHENYFHTKLDLGSENQVRSWINVTKKKFKKIDILICNAAIVGSSLFLSLTPGNVVDSFLKSNITGVFYVLREVSKQMILQQSGRIIAISSITTATNQEGTSIYTATKNAVNGMIKILAKEIAENNITCNIIAPGMMDTEATQILSKSKKWKKEMLEKQTIPKIIDKVEVAHTIDFLINNLSRNITGQIIHLGLVN